jgi:hypothetical protein
MYPKNVDCLILRDCMHHSLPSTKYQPTTFCLLSWHRKAFIHTDAKESAVKPQYLTSYPKKAAEKAHILNPKKAAEKAHILNPKKAAEKAHILNPEKPQRKHTS